MSVSTGKIGSKGVLTEIKTSNGETPGIIDKEGLTFDKKYEFDASRYYDFQKGTPSDDSGDKWFFTDAPKALISPTDTGTTTTSNGTDSLPLSTSTNNSIAITNHSNKDHTPNYTTQETTTTTTTITNNGDEDDEYKDQENIAPPPIHHHISNSTDNHDDDSDAKITPPVVSVVEMDLSQQQQQPSSPMPIESAQQHDNSHNQTLAIADIHRPPQCPSPVTTMIATALNETTTTTSTISARHVISSSQTTTTIAGRRRVAIVVTAAPNSKTNQQFQPPIQPSIPLELLEAARRRGLEIAAERERQRAEDEKRQEEEWKQRQLVESSRANASAVGSGGGGGGGTVVVPAWMKKKIKDGDGNHRHHHHRGRPVTCSQLTTTTSRSKKPLTIPKSPALTTKARIGQCDPLKTTEQLELERIEKEKVKEAQLRQRNAETIKAIISGAPYTTDMYVTQRSYEHFEAAAGRKRKRGNGNVGGGGDNVNFQNALQHQGLTVAKSPNFATKRRVRPSRFKPTEQQEFEEMEAARARKFPVAHHRHEQQQQQASEEVHQLDALVSRMHIKPVATVQDIIAAANIDKNVVAIHTGANDDSTEKVAVTERSTKFRRTTLHFGKALRVPVDHVENEDDSIVE